MSEILDERLRDLYSSYEHGSLDFVVHAFAENAVFITLAPTDVFPYLGASSVLLCCFEEVKKLWTDEEAPYEQHCTRTKYCLTQ